MTAIQQGLHDIYDMEYERAAGSFQSMIRQDPDDPAGYVYLAKTYWVEELFRRQELSTDRFAASDFFVENPKYAPQIDAATSNRLRQLCQQALDKARVRLSKNPADSGALFLRGLAYQNLAAIEVAQQRWWPAFRYGSKTLRDHRELLDRDPALADAKLAVGVCDYVAGSLPWSVRWLAVFFGHPGSKDRGRQELEAAAEQGVLVGDDARVILILIHLHEKRYERAEALLSELHAKYPQNYLSHLDLGALALLRKQPAKAISIYEDILRMRDGGKAKYSQIERAALFNRLGVALRQNGDLTASAQAFRRALQEESLSSRSSTIAHLELGKALDRMGQRQEALENYKFVAAAPDIAGTQAEAARLLKRPY